MSIKHLVVLSALFGLLTSCVTNKVIDTVPVEGGLVQGVLSPSHPDVRVFKGIPFAAPPTGDLRWKKPQPVIPWEGVMVADHFKKICPQVLTRPLTSYPEKYRNLYTEHDEDCLFLNVWAPAGTVGRPEAKLPVMFWIHGGGNSTGSGITMSTDGDAWAQHGVILVTINYRLNVLGFLCHPELTAEQGTSGNYGLYDQVAALKWTYENIAQFGGDPDNITIAGQSAGGGDVRSLSISPLAKPYIAKAIVESGGGLNAADAPSRSVSLADLEARGQEYFTSGGFETLAQMRAASYSEIIEKCEGRPAGGVWPDGEILTESFEQAVYNGRMDDIPYLIGYNDSEEARSSEGVHRFCSYRAQTSKQPAYEYMFCRTPGKSGDCPHSGELVYVFNTLDRRDEGNYPQADYDLSEQVVTWWTNFCKYANPNGKDVDGEWKPYTPEAGYTQVIDVQ